MPNCACGNDATKRVDGDNVCDRCNRLDHALGRQVFTNHERGLPVEDRTARERGRELEYFHVMAPIRGGRHPVFDLL